MCECACMRVCSSAWVVVSTYACVRVYVQTSMCVCEWIFSGVHACSMECKESPF